MCTDSRAPDRLPAWLDHYRRLQVLAPHPDDEVFGAAGLIQQAILRGLEIRVHIATDGERCFGELTGTDEQRLRQARREESQAAAQILGYPAPCFWNLGDGQLNQRHASLRQYIKQHHTADSLWVVPWPNDGHPDHEAAGQAAACLPVPILHYAIWALIDTARLAQFQSSEHTHRLNLSLAQLARKQQAAQCFATQFTDGRRAQGRIITQHHLSRFITPHEMYRDGD